MTFTVIIPVYRDWDRLQLCIDALSAQTIPQERFEVIVVDNEPESGLKDGLSLPANVQVLCEPRPGSYAARNRGAEDASGTYLAFTDSDCIPRPDWLEQAEATLGESGADLLAGRIDVFRPEGGGKMSYVYEKYTAFSQEKYVKNGHGVTANLIVKRSVYNEAEGFRDSLKSGGDWEFTSRCTDHGYRLLYSGSVVVNHPANHSIGDILKKQRRLTCWGSIQAQERFRYSPFRVMASHVATGLKMNRSEVAKPGDRLIVHWMDLIIYLYRSYVHLLIVLKLTDPKSVRS